MFSIKESVRFGWETTKSHLGLLLGVTAIYVILSALPDLFSGPGEDYAFSTILVVIASVIISTIIQIGYTKINLKLHDKEGAVISDLFMYYSHFWNYIVAYVLYSLAIVIGFILFVVPGIYLALRFAFVLILVVDKNMKPLDAFKKSSEMTDGKKLHLLKFFLVIALINILGFIALGLGMLISIPVSALAFTSVYRKILKPETVSEEEPIREAEIVAL